MLVAREREFWPDGPVDASARRVQLQVVWRMLQAMVSADHPDWSAGSLFALRDDLDRVRSRLRSGG